VVNLDLLSKNAASILPVSGVVDTVVVRLGRLFAHKLLESGQTAAAQLLALEQTETSPAREAELYMTELECPLLIQAQQLSALCSLSWRSALLEDKVLELLASRARKELNVITDDPPLATRLAQEIETILAASPFRGTAGESLERLQEERVSALTRTCGDLLGKQAITWGDLVRAKSPTPVFELLNLSSRLLQAVAHLEQVLSRVEGLFGKAPGEEHDSLHRIGYRQKLKNRKTQTLQNRQLKNRHNRSVAVHWEDEAAQSISERNFLGFAVGVDNIISQFAETLEYWSKNEIARASKQRSRLLEVENFIYADCVRRNLHQQGEALEDAVSCAEKLLGYCQENHVSATELMDDEIWMLFPRINRENLKQARLKVRHSDENFPLSVAHREWISQITERALGQRA
jgi:hypothetical protein